MSIISERIFELIVHKLSNELSPDEERELGEWLSEDACHHALWEEYCQIYGQMKQLDRPFSPDTEAALQKVKGCPKSLVAWKKVMTWAAVLALPLCVGLWLLFYAQPEEGNRLFSRVAQPGGERAILKIAGRSEIELSGADTLIVVDEGTRIKTDSNHILSFLMDTKGGDLLQKENQLVVPRGGEYRVTLSDGTRVWVNSASVLTFPQVFTGAIREVKLVGEAFFEVMPDSLHPFVVSTSEMDIKVLGTSFNVSAYGKTEPAHTTLVKGKVEIQTAGHEPVILLPGEQACLVHDSVVCREVNPYQYTSWIDGKFMFCNTALEDISRQISRWYDVDIFFSNEQVKSIRFTGAILRFGPLEELIQMIERTSNVRFGVKGKTIIISEQ